jgi:hypothetical protein
METFTIVENTNTVPALPGSMVTPVDTSKPMCQCLPPLSTEAVLKQVKKDGPSKGKFFWTCGNRQWNAATKSASDGCNFFMYDEEFQKRVAQPAVAAGVVEHNSLTSTPFLNPNLPIVAYAQKALEKMGFKVVLTAPYVQVFLYVHLVATRGLFGEDQINLGIRQPADGSYDKAYIMLHGKAQEQGGMLTAQTAFVVTHYAFATSPCSEEKGSMVLVQRKALWRYLGEKAGGPDGEGLETFQGEGYEQFHVMTVDELRRVPGSSFLQWDFGFEKVEWVDLA